MKPNIGRAILGGFIGTVLLTFVMRVMTGQRMDMAAKLGDMTGTGRAIGLAMHFFIGSVVFGLIYVFVLFRFLPGAPWIKGLISGVVFWLGLEVAMMPMIGGGFFSSQMGGMKIVVAALIAHLVYGAALAVSREWQRQSNPENSPDSKFVHHRKVPSGLFITARSWPQLALFRHKDR